MTEQCLKSILFFIALYAQMIVNAQTFVNPHVKNTGKFVFEKAVNSIFLYDAKSVETKLGKEVWEKHEFDAKNGYPRIEMYNKNKSQILRLFFMEGGFKNEPAGFQILQVPKDYKTPDKAFTSRMHNFKTQRGIFLGMAKQNVIKILGKGFDSKKEGNGRETITYYTNNENDRVFKEYKGVGYSIIAVFKNNKLTDYSFGFEYP